MPRSSRLTTHRPPGTRRVLLPAAGLIACVAVMLALDAGPASGQLASRIDRERGHTMLRAIRKDIETRHYDPGHRGIDLDARVGRASAGIDSARSLQEIFAHIAQLTLEFGDSHTFFLPPTTTTGVDYGWTMEVVGDTTYVTDVRRKSDAEAQGVSRGDRVLSVNGYAPTRENLWQMMYVYHVLRPQPGLRVVLQSPGGEPRQLDLAARVRHRKRVIDLTGQDGGNDIWAIIGEYEEEAYRWRPRLTTVGDDVLLWEIRTFSGYRDDIRNGLRKLRGKRAAVIDLRGNGGGAQRSLLELVAGVFAEEVPVASLRGRRDTTELTASGRGRGAFTGELVVLVDAGSASASEMFARTIQLRGRGKVIGDRTAGAVQRSRIFPHHSGGATVFLYSVSIADAEVILPDGATLERVGVTPDEIVLPSARDLAAGDDPALARALALIGVEIDARSAGALVPER